MKKIITLPAKKKVENSKPPGPRGPIGGGAAVKKLVFTQAIGKRAA